MGFSVVNVSPVFKYPPIKDKEKKEKKIVNLHIHINKSTKKYIYIKRSLPSWDHMSSHNLNRQRGCFQAWDQYEWVCCHGGIWQHNTAGRKCVGLVPGHMDGNCCPSAKTTSKAMNLNVNTLIISIINTRMWRIGA